MEGIPIKRFEKLGNRDVVRVNRRFPAVITMIVTVCLAIFSAGVAEKIDPDLSTLSLSALTQLKTDIATEIRQHHTIISRIEEAVLGTVQKTTEEYYAAQGITVSWAWYGWEYQYAREKDVFTFHSHLDYTDEENRGHQVKVDAEVYWDGTDYVVHSLFLDGQLAFSNGVELPENGIIDQRLIIVNERTGINVSLLSAEELNELNRKVEREIDANHTPKNSGKVNDVLKKTVDDYYSGLGVKVEWPWRDYSYTADWDCYTETTYISYDRQGEKFQDIPVYAELFPAEGSYRVYYLSVGDTVLTDELETVTGGNALLFLQSRAYEEASALYRQERYAEAYERYAAAGDYADSPGMRAECQEKINQQKYEKAQSLYTRGNYEEASAAFEALGDYSDSRERMLQCQEAIRELAYQHALELMKQGEYREAIAGFAEIPGYRDSEQQIEACEQAILKEKYDWAMTLMQRHRYDDAIRGFTEIEEYGDSRERIEECTRILREKKYTRAKAQMTIGHYEKAIELFESLDGYEDSAARIEICREKISQRSYATAEALLEKGLFAEAESAFLALGAYSDSAERAGQIRSIMDSINREIVFPEAAYTMFQGDKITLEPEIRRLRDDAAEDTKLVWQTDNPSVARIGKDGAITAGQIGEATIFCEAEDNPYIAAEVAIHVVKSVNRVTLNTNKMNLTVPEQNGNSTGQLSVTVDPADALVQTGVWTSSNEEAAVVDQDGTIRGVGIGKTVITFTSDDSSKGKKTATCTVNVAQAVTSVTLAETAGTVFVGKTVKLKTTVEPQNAVNKRLTYTSEDEKIATVNANGEIRGIRSGETRITAASPDGPSAEYAVVVRVPPTTLKVTVTAKCVARNKVGSKWEQAFYLNGETINGTRKITVEEGETFEIGCTIRENDWKPDVGEFTETIEATPEIMTKGTRIERKVLVEENEGRYKGNAAEWKIVFTIKP